MRIAHIKTAGLALLIAAAITAQAAPKLSISDVPVFINLGSQTNCYPVWITCENNGPDTSGRVVIGNQFNRVSYPIDLPHGSKRKFLAYPSTQNMYGPLELRLETENGTVESQINPQGSPYGTGQYVAMITDSPGQMNFLRPPQSQSGDRSRDTTEAMRQYATDIYAKPGALPDRGLAYSSMAAVVLADGAERMKDDEVKALQNYILTGGNVIVLGGASSPILRDPRWASLLPIAQPQTKTLPQFNFRPANLQLREPVTITVGTLARGSRIDLKDGNEVLAASKPYGAGAVRYLAANPFEAPLSGWDGRKQLLQSILSLNTVAQRKASLESLAGVNDNNPDRMYGSYAGPPTSSMPYPTPAEGVKNDPFRVTLPDTSTIVMILLAYFVLVVPINLLVLRKLGKGELAWVTAPLLSLAFAGVFFNFAGNLYAAQLSKQTVGLVIADKNGSTAYAFGQSQLFFPKAGSYDLGMKNTDYVGAVINQYYNMRPDANLANSLNLVDNREVQIPNMIVPNLSFYQFRFEQRIPDARWIEADLKVVNGNLDGKVVNKSNYTLRDCEVWNGDREFMVGDLKPGEAKTFQNRAMNMMTGNPLTYVSQERTMIFGEVVNYELGPTLGKSVAVDDRGPQAVKLLQCVGGASQ